MLEAALKARLPLIAVHTRDPLNVAAMLQHFAGDLTVLSTNDAIKDLARLRVNKHALYVVWTYDENILPQLFAAAAEAGSVIVFVNPEEVHATMFDAGTLQLPEAMLREFVEVYAPDESLHYELEAALRGLTFKEVVEVSKLAMVESSEFTAEAVLRVRRSRTVLSSGLKLVDTHQHYYDAPAQLTRWLQIDGRLFTANVDRLVRPRGLLFSGSPGTGKTSGAKYLAQQLKLPLYLFDVGSTMQKYVGESERTFQTALAQADTLGPCVLLLDEVEKAFDQHDESGVSKRVLGMLLWWLQEHQSQVLTIMTTNDVATIPQELVRPGRIDQHMVFEGLTYGQAVTFAREVALSLKPVCAIASSEVDAAVDKLKPQLQSTYSQAAIHQLVVELVKVQLAAQLREW